jgi:hypothetical protein
MATIPYTKLAFIQRIRKHVANSRATNDEFQASDNEILLLIDSAIAFNCIGQMFNNAKIENNLATPEAYLTTYLLSSLISDSSTGYWYATLPQPPISMPLGYSIDRVYFTDPSFGTSKDAYPIRPKELAYLSNLPLPYGIRYWVENKKIYLAAHNNQMLLNLTPYVRMIKTRTDDINEDMALPDDAIQMVFDKVVQELLQRYGVPQDIVKDSLGAGNKSS